MGTKNKPLPNDCYSIALQDEPMFVLLARDPDAPSLVRRWADRRHDAISSGEKPITDIDKVYEARLCASAMENWRRLNDGKWRK